MKNQLNIIIPCYNAEQYIGKCLDSLLKAVARVGEDCCDIIVVNDGSTDGTLGILQRYDSHLRILTTENQGVSSARNHGLANINRRGYVWFIDADDEVAEDSLEFIFSSLERNPSDGIIFDFEYVKNEERKTILRNDIAETELHKKLQGDAVVNEVIAPLFGLSQVNADRYFEGKFPYMPGFLSGGAVWHYVFSSSILHDNGLFFRSDMKMGEDSMFLLRYLCYVKEINIINAKLYYYYERPSGALERIKRSPSLLFDCKMQLAEERNSINELCIKKYGRDMSCCYDASLLFSALELCIKLSREKYFGNIGMFLRYTSFPPVRQAIRRIDLTKAPLKYRIPIRILQTGCASLLYSILYFAQKLGYKVNV